jgi:biofilm PGA synthesis N-glycosyltransferase PgaC
MEEIEKIKCSVGVTAYNEEANIGALLEALLHQHLYEVEITEIIVVASGCTDNTVPIVQEYQKKYPDKIKLFTQERREGKTSAINVFLQHAKEDICVLESGDTLPREDAIEHLVKPLRDPKVGMTGAHKVPLNTPDHIAGLFTHLRLKMEHQLSMEIPRLGELIAFRKVFDRIPPDIAMDEAFVEAIVVKRGLQVKYAPNAVVYNSGPTTISDFVRQRRRNYAGHLYLRQKYGYVVSSMNTWKVLKVGLSEIWGALKLIGVLILLAVLEAYARLLGWYDFAIKKKRHVVWDMAWTQKVNLQDARKNEDKNALSIAASHPTHTNIETKG